MILINKAAVFAGVLLLFNTASIILANANMTIGSVTEVAPNKTDTGKGEKPGSSIPWLWIMAAAVLTVVFFIGCYMIKKKADSSGYASGDNIPKPLAGLSEDF